MKNLRKIIRESLERLFTEMDEIPHFGDRVYDRLESDDTTFKDEKQSIKDIAFENIEFLRKLNFKSNANVGFLVLKSHNKYVYHRVLSNGTIEHSEGKFMWAVARFDELETIVFGDASYTPRNTQIHLTVDQVRSYVFNEKGGDMTITAKDIRRMQTPDAKPEVSKGVVVNMLGTKWVLDPEKEIFFKKNKPSETVSVWDVLEDKIEGVTTDEATKDEIMSHLM
jgi:hypothetical protein